MSVKEFRKQITERGWFLFPDIISLELIARMKVDLDKCYVRCREIQLKNGLDNTQYTVHHLVGQEPSFLDCLTEYEKLNPYFECYFEGKYILNSMGGNILKKESSYANAVHRDIRSYSGDIPLMLNTLVFLDDFTPENGATWLMSGGHKLPDKPSEEMFNDACFQITGKAGSVAVWNSNLWHRAGVNNTDEPRRSLTPEFTKPFMKQGYEYTQFVEEDTPEYLKQVLGWYSRTPASLNDWYQRPDERFYRSDQG